MDLEPTKSLSRGRAAVLLIAGLPITSILITIIVGLPGWLLNLAILGVAIVLSVKGVSVGALKGWPLAAAFAGALALNILLGVGTHSSAKPPPTYSLSLGAGKPDQNSINEALEKQNHAKIVALQAKIAELPKDDWVGRRDLFQQLSLLVPANQAFAAQANAAQAEYDARKYLLDHPEANIRIKRFSWTKGGFGIAYVLDITLENTSDYALKDFQISCENRAASQTVLGITTGAIMDKLAPHQTRRFRHVVLGAVDPAIAFSACKITAAAPY